MRVHYFYIQFCNLIIIINSESIIFIFTIKFSFVKNKSTELFLVCVKESLCECHTDALVQRFH